VAREDEDVSLAIQEFMQAEGIGFALNAKCLSLRRDGDGCVGGLDCSVGDSVARGSHVLLAVGRVPNTDDLGLDKAGVQGPTRAASSRSDEGLRTANPRVWALGDCNGKARSRTPPTTTTRSSRTTSSPTPDASTPTAIPVYALFTDPPLGRVGMNEAEIRKAGIKARVGKYPMNRWGVRSRRARPTGSSRSTSRIQRCGRILGASLLGTGADESVHSLIDAVYSKMPYPEFQRHVRIHPTVSELLPTTLESLKEMG
jgi:pyruvate/2-oxoglutarate dehydrogenase complex dihydrolipoamide dehydrogenase (E3) component